MTKRAVLTQLGMLIVSLAIAEGALQIASRSSLSIERLLAPPWDVDHPLVDDPRLIYRGNPLKADHDSAGYRNPTRPARADIVTLGDSQTYGPADDAGAGWPQALARARSQTVYNMAVPAYGPGQSLLQLDEALSLRPRLIVVAPYFGNDLYDCYRLALRHPDLVASVASELRETASRLESERPLRSEVLRLYTLITEENITPGPPVPPSWYKRLKLYGLVRAVLYRLLSQPPPKPLLSRRFATAAAAVTPAQREVVVPFDGADWRTLLTPRYRGRWLDDRDPRIRVGFEVMEHALLGIATRTRAGGVALLVVLIPTKESVFWPRVPNPDDYPGLRQMVADESRLRLELIHDLQAHGIDYVDGLEPLREAPAQPYFEDVDGHPNALGHRVIADALAQHLARSSSK